MNPENPTPKQEQNPDLASLNRFKHKYAAIKSSELFIIYEALGDQPASNVSAYKLWEEVGLELKRRDVLV